MLLFHQRLHPFEFSGVDIPDEGFPLRLTEDIAQILDFYSGIRVRNSADTKIMSIVNEELSYWKANARSLEETTKIIDSRVWIYLNE